MKLHFITDAETIGPVVFKCPIINFAYAVFDWDRFTSDNPYTFEELITKTIVMDKLDVRDQASRFGYKPKKAHLDWWAEQGDYAKQQLKPSESDNKYEDFVVNLEAYIEKETNGKGIKRWWSRSNAFDPVLIQRIYQDVSTEDNLNKILPFWLLRDTRTFLDTKFDFKLQKNGFCPIEDEDEWKKKFVLHNSIHDVAADILRLQRVEIALNCD